MSDGARILIVDDDQSVVDYLVEALGSRYVVVAETSPQAALARVHVEEFEVVISDVEMPGMRGPDLLAAILEVRPRQAVVIITAFGSISLAVEMVRAGACDFITKPLKKDVLIVAIERALRERAMRREIVRLRRDLGEEEEHDIVAKSAAMQGACLTSRVKQPVPMPPSSLQAKAASARELSRDGFMREALVEMAPTCKSIAPHCLRV